MRLEASANHSSEKERTFPPNAADTKSEYKSVQLAGGISRHVCESARGWGNWIITNTKKHNVSVVDF